MNELDAEGYHRQYISEITAYIVLLPQLKAERSTKIIRWHEIKQGVTTVDYSDAGSRTPERAR
jgi:hypothetical protein